MKTKMLFMLVAIASLGCSAQDLTRYVDPFIGVDGGGNVLPGPCLPFSMIRVGPDVQPPQNTTGYNSSRLIDGFSQNHVSGTGGSARYGNFMLIPQTGDVQIKNYSSEKEDEQASVGYYSVLLKRWNVKAELTCSERTAFHRYTFPESRQSQILLDASRVINTSGNGNVKCIDASLRVLSDTEISGYGIFIGGWGHGEPYRVYFAAEFDTPFQSYSMWTDDEIVKDARQIRNDKCGFIAHYATEENQQIQVKISIAYDGTDNASAFLEQIPHWDFEKQIADNKSIWNSYFERIKIEGASEEQLTLFYTSFYRCLVMPTDITGDNPGWHSDKPTYWDYYCIWDTFRSLNPFLTIIAPDKQRDIVRSLVDVYEHTGWMPDAWIAGNIAFKQVGTNGDVLIADAIAKGLEGIDYEKAYEGMVKNVTVFSDEPMRYGRHKEYLIYGFCPMDVRCGSSYTLEYAHNDFCIAQVAKALGKMDDYEKYIEMSKNCYNLFNEETKYFWAKDINNNWAPDFSPEHHGDPWWRGPYFYEGTPAHYATYVPHDIQGLVERHGGREEFFRFLDNIFDKDYYTHVNEPDILTPFLYNYVGAPYRTSERVRNILKTEYKVARDGWPGNDDSGCMSSWYIFGSLGFYPNAGQDVYLISSPVFTKSEIDLQNGNKFIITAKNLFGENIYIQSATLNNKKWDKTWFQHKDIIGGAELVLEMGPEPSDWGRDAEPPFSITKAKE